MKKLLALILLLPALAQAEAPNLTLHFGYDLSSQDIEGGNKIARKFGTGLDLSSVNIEDKDLKQLLTKPFANVRWVSLRGTDISDQGLRYLKKLPLKTLVLEETQITGSGFTHLKGTPLKTLILENSAVRDYGLGKLKGLSIEELNLTGTQISDQGLLELRGLPIKQLNLYSTPITNQGLEYLLDLGFKLEKLYLTGTQTTLEMVERLRDKMPETVIIY